MRKNHILKSALLFVLTLFLVLSLVSCGDVTTKNGVVIKKDATPTEFFEAVMENTKLEYSDPTSEQIMQLFNSVFSGGAISLSADIPDAGKADIYLIPNNAGVLSMAADIAGIAKVNLFGSFDEIAVKAEFSQDGFNAGGSYGLSLKDFDQNFEKSVFAPGKDSAYSLPQEAIDAIHSLIDRFDSEKIKAICTDLETVLKDAAEEFDTKYPLEKVNNEDKTFTLKTTITESQSAEWIRSILEKTLNTASVKEFIKDLEELVGEEFPDLLAMFDEAAWSEDGVDDRLSVEIHVSEDYLIDKLSVSVNADNGFFLTLAKTENGYKTEEEIKAEGKSQSATAAYTKESDGTVKYDCVLKTDEDEQTMSFVWNKDTDKALTITSDMITGKGTLDLNAEQMVLSFKEIEVDGEKEEFNGVMTFFAKADPAKAPTFEYTDILTLDEESMDQVMSVIGVAFFSSPDDPDIIDHNSTWDCPYDEVPAPDFGEILASIYDFDDCQSYISAYEPQDDDTIMAYINELSGLRFSYVDLGIVGVSPFTTPSGLSVIILRYENETDLVVSPLDVTDVLAYFEIEVPDASAS